ncbi:uncharacterized protein LOC133205754 [Saccostrea echinata]|uniref:uncharacterized protein LOC133205754 n=1 Tax=Saccostrea echinata TaxID=191078 RepID=UPI002A83FABF|nr:uncharacterized protein LOC133205754 [Saccostrea echinata]
MVSTNFDIINEVHIKILCKRLSTEVRMLTEKKLFNLLKNERTLREFIEELKEKEDELNEFFNSDFFRFTCWSDNVLTTEFLLRRMKDKRIIIENALDCCSETVRRALKKHLNSDSSEATAIPPSPTIYGERHGPFENTLTFDALECQCREFPRLRYHNKLVRGLADRFAKLQTEISELKIIDFIHWKQTNENPVIYVAGKNLGKSFSFVSKRREEKITIRGIETNHNYRRLSKPTFADFKGRSPSCILYDCGDEVSKQNLLTEIRKLSMNVAASALTSFGPCVIIVLKHEKYTLSPTDLRDMSVNGVQIVASTGDSDLLENFTSAFEIMMIEYIKLLQSKLCFEFAPSAKQIRSLKTESDAVIKRLQLASKLPKQNTDTPASMSIPEAILAELDNNADKIYGYGFRPDEFYVLICDSLSSVDKETLQKKILESKESANSNNATSFLWNIKFENSKGVKIMEHFGSGSPLLPDQTKPHKFGTLGGFAQINSKDVVGLTNYHVVGKNIVAYVKDGDTLVKLGKSTFVLVPGEESLADVALIEVEKCVLNRCQKPLVDDEDEPKSATIFLGTPDQICPAIVHKKGASTGITQGTVVDIMTYRDVLGERETQSAFLVEDTEKPFSAPGDSGSIVFQNSLSASQEDIEVVAILNGRYKRHDEEEESSYVLCSNMTYVYEKLHRMGKKLQFFKKD